MSDGFIYMGHCCVCTGVCYHTGGPYLCARHQVTDNLAAQVITTPNVPFPAPPMQVPDGFAVCGTTDTGMRVYCCVRCGAAVFFTSLHDQHVHNDNEAPSSDRGDSGSYPPSPPSTTTTNNTNTNNNQKER